MRQKRGRTMTKTEALAACPLFKDTDSALIERLLADERTEWRGLSAGECLFCADSETQPKLTVLASGVLSVYRDRVLLNEITAPGTVGAATLFGGEAQTTVKAKKPSRVLIFTQTQVEELITEDKNFALAYIRFLSGRIRFLNSRIASFTAGSAEAKLAGYLASHSADGVCTVSRTKLASELDMGRASLYRAIDSLTEKNLIETDGKTIHILDTDGLLSL